MNFTKATTLLLAGALVAACSDSDPVNVNPPPPPPPAMAQLDMTISNLTNAQPLSPVGVIAHVDGYSLFTLGMPAGAGLEEMAEGGDNTAMLAEAAGDANVRATASGADAIGPGMAETISIEVLESDLASLRISAGTMLVNTNDAITVLNAMDVSALAPGDAVMARTIAYDAGTEANSEEAVHIPGPAGGGEGFNAARDDIADQVTMHPGVVSADDGFASSGLTEQHRFDNAVAAVRIERIN